MKLTLWAVFWSIVIAGIGAGFVGLSIGDARMRADLAIHGIRSTAILIGDRCGRSSNPTFRVSNGAGRTRDICSADDPVPKAIRDSPSGTVVDIVYKARHPRVFVVAPGGRVPQSDISNIWQRWRHYTLILLTIYLPILTIFMWVRHVRANDAPVPERQA